MAFNPFSGFQKNKKFWMASLTLMTMVTFVLCTGMRGDVGEKILAMFRKRGSIIAEVASYRLSYEDLSRMRSDRNMVNEFMLKCCHVTVENLGKEMEELHKKPLPKDPKQAQEQQQIMVLLHSMQITLIERMRKPRFFEGGVKFDDLVEFKLWQTQADRLGIRLEDDHLHYLFRNEFFSAKEMHITQQQIENAQWEAVRNSRDFGERNLWKALAEEYRVRLAQIAMLEMQTSHIDPTSPDQERAHMSLAQLWNVYKEKRSEFDITLIPVQVADFTKDVPEPDDNELEKLFEKHRREKYDPASPLPSFETPIGVKVEFLLADPTSPVYAGTSRAKTVLEMVLPLIGSPLQSPVTAASRYGAAAAAKQKDLHDVLEGLSSPKRFELYRTADLGAADFIWPMAAHFAQRDPRAIASLIGGVPASLGDPALAGSAAWAGFLAEAADRHGDELRAGLAAEVRRRTVPYAKVAVAGAIGEPAGMYAAVQQALGLRRVPGALFSELLLLPEPIIERELEKVVEDRTAEQWASRNLLAIKRLIDKNPRVEAIKRVIKDSVPKHNLIHVVTKGYYKELPVFGASMVGHMALPQAIPSFLAATSAIERGGYYMRFDIEKAPELQPLREAYERYFREINWFEKRDITPERMLKEGDFYKLFFDNEHFASSAKYQVRPWPPEVIPNPMQVRTIPGVSPAVEMPNISGDVIADVQRVLQTQGSSQQARYRLLDKAQKPILFWRMDEKPAEFPQKLADARDRVLQAWKKQQARELKAIPTAKKVAEDLVNTGGEFEGMIGKAAEEARSKPIVISKMAPLVPREVGERLKGGHRDYVAYQLPKDLVPEPRDDMVSQLLNLYSLKQPVEIKTALKEGESEPAFVKQLNDLNKVLFDKVRKEKKPDGHFVQVLTNKPQSVYYVAAMTKLPAPDLRDFQESVVKWASQNRAFVDTFAARGQEVVARDLHARLLQQLKDELGWSPPSDQNLKLIQDFNTSDHGG
jgi:hypothetical protein